MDMVARSTYLAAGLSAILLVGMTISGRYNLANFALTPYVNPGIGLVDFQRSSQLLWLTHSTMSAPMT